MVLPWIVQDAAREGNLAAVQEYLADADRDPDELGEDGTHLLWNACVGRNESRRQDVVRFLLMRGASPNALCHRREADPVAEVGPLTPLHAVLMNTRPQSKHMLKLSTLLVDAGADPMLLVDESAFSDRFQSSAFGFLLYHGYWNFAIRQSYELLVLFLRAGASNESLTSKGALKERRHLKACLNIAQPEANQAKMRKCLDLIDAILAAGGTWRQYCLVPHKRLLRLRSLVARGRASPGPSTPAVVARLLAPSLPNGVLWHILEHWSATR